MTIIRQKGSFLIGGGRSPRLDDDRNSVRVIYLHLGFWTVYFHERIDRQRYEKGQNNG